MMRSYGVSTVFGFRSAGGYHFNGPATIRKKTAHASKRDMVDS